MPGSQPKTETTSPRAVWIVAAVVALFLAVPAAVLILAGSNAGRAAFDATAYHLRFIRDLAAQCPDFDLSNPLTATTPGYHIVLALVARAGADSLEALRFASLAIGCAFVATVASWYARRTRPLAATVLALPLVASVYVLGAAAWTVPDNLAWLLVVSILWLALMERAGAKRLALACVLLVALVSVRQIHIWAAAVIWAAAFADARRVGLGLVPSCMRAAAWGVATLPAFAVLWLFYRHWGGLAPPRFQNEVQGMSASTPAFLMLQVAILAVGFLPWTLPAVRRAWRDSRTVLFLAGASGLILAVAPVTTASFADGRFGGWWSLVERAPSIAGRTSLLMVAAAPVGALVLAALITGLPPRARMILGITLAAFAAAMTSNHYPWQRYHEPFLLCFIPACLLLQRERIGPLGLLRLAPTVMLALCFWAISAAGFRGQPLPPDTLPSPQHFAPGDAFLKDSASAERQGQEASANRGG